MAAEQSHDETRTIECCPYLEDGAGHADACGSPVGNGIDLTPQHIAKYCRMPHYTDCLVFQLTVRESGEPPPAPR
ncbi:MAG TPA: hypothetical protein VF898_01455, partial [Chloroflexota bacterium]